MPMSELIELILWEKENWNNAREGNVGVDPILMGLLS